MDNFQKALQMAFAVFLFVIAATTAIFLYTKLNENTDMILLISDRNRSSAETASTMLGDDSIRYATKAEVIMTILDIDNNKSYLNEIEILTSGGASVHTYEVNNGENNLRNIGKINSEFYSKRYDDSDKTLTYTAISTP